MEETDATRKLSHSQLLVNSIEAKEIDRLLHYLQKITEPEVANHAKLCNRLLQFKIIISFFIIIFFYNIFTIIFII